MKILVVERTFPWPMVSGTAIRVAHIVRALSQVGEVDLFLLSHWGTPAVTTVPEEEPVARFARAPRALRPNRARGLRTLQLEWLATSRLPFSVAMRDYSAVRSAFLAWARPRYDLAWIGRAHSYVPLARHIVAPTIVDLDDLEDRKIDAWLGVASDAKTLAHGARRPPGSVAVGRAWGSLALNMANTRRWRALEQQIAGAVDAVVVCSELDRQRFGMSNTVVVPNAYVPPERPAGRLDPGEPPTILLVGPLTYAPNADAARFLVKEVLPRLRVRLPEARVRLVGYHDDRVEDLRRVDGVTVTGLVSDITAELARADVVAVPVRFGGGTRVKILEAFAHRIPVVSTTLGCEGIDAHHRRHLLIADDPDSFASACVEALADAGLRRSLTEAAHDLFWTRYRSDVVARAVIDLAHEVVAGRGSSVDRREPPERRTARRGVSFQA
jgi:glycosyltransferase involved in cell wall biosynthesis